MTMKNPDYKKKVEEIIEIAQQVCSEWEFNFIESVDEQEFDYTEKQKKIIDRIYERACESPY